MDKHIVIPQELLQVHPNAYALEVTGTCMAPMIPHGASVIVDPDITPSKTAQNIAVVKIRGELHLCRTIRLWGQVVILHDNHRDYPARTISDNQVELVGVVIWAVYDDEGYVPGTNEKSAPAAKQECALISANH